MLFKTFGLVRVTSLFREKGTNVPQMALSAKHPVKNTIEAIKNKLMNIMSPMGKSDRCLDGPCNHGVKAKMVAAVLFNVFPFPL